MTYKETKKVIHELKTNLRMAEELLRHLCPHENVFYDSFDRSYTLDYKFICRDCGMVFITDNPNFDKDPDSVYYTMEILDENNIWNL